MFYHQKIVNMEQDLKIRNFIFLVMILLTLNKIKKINKIIFSLNTNAK